MGGHWLKTDPSNRLSKSVFVKDPPKKPTPKRKERRTSERVCDDEFMLWCKAALPCFLSDAGLADDCTPGTPEFDHMGRRPLGRKCDDRQGAVLCSKHHRERTDWCGFFKDFTGEDMRSFTEQAIAWANMRFDEAHR